MPKNKTNICRLGLIGLALWLPGLAAAQEMTSFDRDRAQIMLHDIAQEIQKHYYDPNFHGVDWKAKVEEARTKIDKATSLNMSLSHIAAAVDSLNDSHTFFLPPARPYRHDYGWQREMIGDHCFVIRVRPGSDAEAKGMKPGDEVLGLNGYAPDRQNIWKIDYIFTFLRPQPGLHVALRDPAGHDRQVDVMAKFIQKKRVTDLTGADGASDFWDYIRELEGEDHRMRLRYIEKSDELMILKIPSFHFDMDDADTLASKARKHQALIIDLRGNLGGAVDSLKYLLSKVFDSDVKIGDRVGRKEKKPEIAKSNGRNSFAGKLIVLIDSRSASAAELFARLVQLEKRGVVIGDRSSGSVMEAKHYSLHLGADTAIFYGASITESDLIMSDGKSLEHVGVTPDEVVLPTASDLANGLDPVLAHAASLAGVKLSPEAAGKMLPYEWPAP